MSVTDIPTINDEIARKFRKIKAGLTTSRSAVELFEALLARIETAGLLSGLEASTLLCDRINSIEQARFLEIIPDTAPPLLVNGDLRPFFRLLPRNQKYFIRSLAVSPITLHGRVIGSMNHGDASPTRYEPGMDTTLLRQLARSVSSRLARLLPPGSG